MNQCLKPLQSSTSSNLVDMGWCSKGDAIADGGPTPVTLAPGDPEAAQKTVMYVRIGCSGKAGHQPGPMEISERGNHLDTVWTHSGRGHRLCLGSRWDGVLVVVRGRESRPHGEGGQQVRNKS